MASFLDFVFLFFFFKQKTAYEMRISDWSSDVCSSDLVFVYSPRVEGIHLRAGPVARGGLRWSDRRDDFRTEILGLMKAQRVKNAVIVPTGAKGGFYQIGRAHV